jgi:hypothetical protein
MFKEILFTKKRKIQYFTKAFAEMLFFQHGSIIQSRSRNHWSRSPIDQTQFCNSFYI